MVMAAFHYEAHAEHLHYIIRMEKKSLFAGLPSDEAMAAELGRSIAEHQGRPVRVTICGRQPSRASSTHPCEVISFTVNGGDREKVLVKFCPPVLAPSRRWPGVQPTSYGLAYEARVYTRILQPLGLATQRFYGYGRVDGPTEWLAVEYLDAARAISCGRELVDAASWIGSFHAVSNSFVSPVPLLKIHDVEYYEAATRAASENHYLTADKRRTICRLQRLFCRAVGELCEQPTVVHGEYFTNNVLFSQESIHVVDWESAVIAAGELDIAFIIRGYPEDLRKQAEAAYARNRWPEGAPKGFKRKLRLADMYRVLRGLGHSRKRPWKSPRYFEELLVLGRELSSH